MLRIADLIQQLDEAAIGPRNIAIANDIEKNVERNPHAVKQAAKIVGKTGKAKIDIPDSVTEPLAATKKFAELHGYQHAGGGQFTKDGKNMLGAGKVLSKHGASEDMLQNEAVNGATQGSKSKKFSWHIGNTAKDITTMSNGTPFESCKTIAPEGDAKLGSHKEDGVYADTAPDEYKHSTLVCHLKDEEGNIHGSIRSAYHEGFERNGEKNEKHGRFFLTAGHYGNVSKSQRTALEDHIDKAQGKVSPDVDHFRKHEDVYDDDGSGFERKQTQDQISRNLKTSAGHDRSKLLAKTSDQAVLSKVINGGKETTTTFEKVASNKHLGEDHQMSLFKSHVGKPSSVLVHSALAGNENLHPNVAEAIHNHIKSGGSFSTIGVVKSLAGNKATPEHILSDLAQHKDVDVKRNVAASTINKDVTHHLIGSEHFLVRKAAFNNDATTFEDKKKAFNTDDRFNQIELAQTHTGNRKITDHMADVASHTHLSLVNNNNTHFGTIRKIVNHPEFSKHVASSIIERHSKGERRFPEDVIHAARERTNAI